MEQLEENEKYIELIPKLEERNIFIKEQDDNFLLEELEGKEESNENFLQKVKKKVTNLLDKPLIHKLTLNKKFIAENFTDDDYENDKVFIEKLYKIIKDDDNLEKKDKEEINNFLIKNLDEI